MTPEREPRPYGDRGLMSEEDDSPVYANLQKEVLLDWDSVLVSRASVRPAATPASAAA